VRCNTVVQSWIGTGRQFVFGDSGPAADFERRGSERGALAQPKASLSVQAGSKDNDEALLTVEPKLAVGTSRFESRTGASNHVA